MIAQNGKLAFPLFLFLSKEAEKTDEESTHLLPKELPLSALFKVSKKSVKKGPDDQGLLRVFREVGR